MSMHISTSCGEVVKEHGLFCCILWIFYKYIFGLRVATLTHVILDNDVYTFCEQFFDNKRHNNNNYYKFFQCFKLFNSYVVRCKFLAQLQSTRGVSTSWPDNT